MTTNAQIRSLFTKVSPASEVDELAIAQYCLKSFKIKDKFLPKIQSLPPITFIEFKAWTKLSLPVPGEIIVYPSSELDDDIIAIVRSVDFKDLLLNARLTSKGLDLSDAKIPLTGWKVASVEERERFIKALSKNGLEWNAKFAKVVEKYIPRNADFIRIAKNGTTIGFGILNEVTPDGELVMYCVKFDGQPLRYSMNENAGNVAELNFSIVSAVEKADITGWLSAVGKVWNAYLKRIEPTIMRAGKGDSYWFLNDKFNVVTAHESLTLQDKKHYLCGNYFTNIEDAYDMARAINELTKKMLCRPERE